MIIPNIFVEGDADVKFIKDYFFFLFNIKLQNKKIQKTGGWTKISTDNTEGESIRNLIKQNTANDENNIIIFDADENPEERRENIESWKTKYGLEFDIFLFPDNERVGELEDILGQIIPESNLDIMECWHKYENCITTKSKERENPLTIPAKKSKIYCYIEALVGISNSEKEKIKDKKRDFLNIEHWHLNSENLQPLKDFIERYVENKSS